MYEIYLERSAEKDLKKLAADDFKRIIDKIKTLQQNPKPHGCRKISGSQNDWRIRIGTYRVVYEIYENDKAVKIMRVKHRKDVYR